MSDRAATWVGPAADAGREALQTLVAANCNPYGQGTLDRVAWWDAFIFEAQKLRENSRRQWLTRIGNV